MTAFGAWIRNRTRKLIHPYRTVQSYRCEFSGEYKKFTTGENPLPSAQRVDVDNRDDVYYMFRVYLTDPSAKIYLEWNDGTCQEIKLGRIEKTKPIPKRPRRNRS